MRLPRGVSGERAIHALEGLGYAVVRQRGSHVGMRHDGPPAHAITVRLHNSLKTGTLLAILSEVAQERSLTVESIVELL
jgi:predicted RNA binding protein YcfA (HicA-like mRNA interferase family)